MYLIVSARGGHEATTGCFNGSGFDSTEQEYFFVLRLHQQSSGLSARKQTARMCISALHFGQMIGFFPLVV